MLATIQPTTTVPAIIRRRATNQPPSLDHPTTPTPAGELETSVPKARMEAEAEAAKAADIKARLEELRAATQVRVESARLPRGALLLTQSVLCCVNKHTRTHTGVHTNDPPAVRTYQSTAFLHH
jgi:hypothetical protein